MTGRTMLRDRESGQLVRASIAGIGTTEEVFAPVAATVQNGKPYGFQLEVLLHRGLVFGFSALLLNLVNLGWAQTLQKGITRAAYVSPWLVPAILLFLAFAPIVLAFLGILFGIRIRRNQDPAGTWPILLGLAMFMVAMLSTIPIAHLGFDAIHLLLTRRA